MQMKRLFIAVAGMAFIAVETVAIPAKAALLDFSFTTETGATGTFTLNTDSTPTSEPALLAPDIPQATGISYPNAVSNFSITASYVNLSNVTTDFNVAPSLTSDFIGLPANLGVLSGVSYPPGCITAPGFTCLFDLAVFYSGNLWELPVLSDNPLSYSRGAGIRFYNPATRERLLTDNITNFQVVQRQPIPEPNSSLSLLAFGIGGVGLVLKRKKNIKKPLAI